MCPEKKDGKLKASGWQCMGLSQAQISEETVCSKKVYVKVVFFLFDFQWIVFDQSYLDALKDTIALTNKYFNVFFPMKNTS